MVELSVIRDLVAIFGVIAGFSYYVLTVRINQRNQEISMKNQELMLKAQQQTLETRQTQLLVQIFDKITNKEFQMDFMEILWDWKWDSYEDYMINIGSKPDKVGKLNHIWETLNGIGVLLENKLVDSKMLYNVIGWGPLLCWEKYGPIFKEWGIRTGEPSMFTGFEYLYNEVNKLYEEKHGYKYGHKVRSIDDALASVGANNRNNS